MGYRLPAEIQNDHVYVHRLSKIRQPFKTPPVYRVSLWLKDKSGVESNSRYLYSMLTGCGQRFDRSI
ncbi:hypothetical protein JOD45_000245 [Scopulibacillus daqui]|uniref:Uncharacterized protein n=1 Tax=Scopulibacillus daqui TaxID=1469162 RepID=A0ABS2PVG9_9BACL|nr:hypothetical protein [Scopulibacillus daqui]MBM7644054.1 hypothetical protein [Scopulibacillus daqui]